MFLALREICQWIRGNFFLTVLGKGKVWVILMSKIWKMVQRMLVFAFFQKKKKRQGGNDQKGHFSWIKGHFLMDKRALSSPLVILCIYYKLVLIFLFKRAGRIYKKRHFLEEKGPFVRKKAKRFGHLSHYFCFCFLIKKQNDGS